MWRMRSSTAIIFGLMLALAVVSYGRFASFTATAAPHEQGINQLPLEFYILMNQPGPLWLARIDLEGVDLSSAKLTGANLRLARLNTANLSGASLVGANLERTNLVGANLFGASLQGAVMSNASLQNSDLRGADLTLTDLTEANLTGAKYDITTIWPSGFDPVAAKATLIQPTPTPVP